MNHYRFTQRAFNVRNVSDIHLFSCLCCSCAFGLIHFIWQLGNPEPFISSSWKLGAAILKPYVEQHHRVLFLIMLKNSLILSTELCIPLRISFSPSCPELIYHLALISKVSLVLFYSAVNAISCCAFVFHLLWVAQSFSSPISLYFEQDLFLNWPFLLRSSTFFLIYFFSPLKVERCTLLPCSCLQPGFQTKTGS